VAVSGAATAQPPTTWPARHNARQPATAKGRSTRFAVTAPLPPQQDRHAFQIGHGPNPFPLCQSTTSQYRSDDDGQHHAYELSKLDPRLPSDPYAELDSLAARYRSTRRSGTSHMMATLVKTSMASQGLTKANPMPERYRTGETLPLRSRPRA
jgi:hypothetical protein